MMRSHNNILRYRIHRIFLHWKLHYLKLGWSKCLSKSFPPHSQSKVCFCQFSLPKGAHVRITRFQDDKTRKRLNFQLGISKISQKAKNQQKEPLKRVEPPESTMLENNVRLKSISDFWIANTSTSCSPSHSSPIRSGRNSSSGARNRAGPICKQRSHCYHY